MQQTAKRRPLLQLAMMVGGLYLTYIGIVRWVASHYVAQGLLDSNWYVTTFGSIISGLALTLGPQLKATAISLAEQWLPKLLGVVVPHAVIPGPVVPTPGGGTTPVTPTPIVPATGDWLSKILGGGMTLPMSVVNSPEISFAALLALAKIAQASKNQPLLSCLKQTTATLFDMCFAIKDVSNATPAPTDTTPVVG